MRTIGGVKVGFIGETLRSTSELLSADASRDLEFRDEADTANRAAAVLERQGVHAIVLLIHEGGAQHSNDEDPNKCEGFSGAIVPIVKKLSRDVKVVLSAHSHRAYNCIVAGHLVTSAASLGRLITRVNLSIDASSGAIVDATANNEVVTRDVPPDPIQTALIDRYGRIVAPVAKREVGTIKGPLVRTSNAAGESSLGDVIADAQLDAGRSLGAQIAFMNDDGIRADLAPSNITFNDLFLVHPFGNTVLTMTIDGRTLKDLLEQQFDNPGRGERRMLQVSAGFSYRYANGGAPGQRVDAASLTLNGRPISPGDRLRIVANDFLHTGGDGMTVLARATDIVSLGQDVDALAAYVRTHSPVDAPAGMRIIRTD